MRKKKKKIKLSLCVTLKILKNPILFFIFFRPFSSLHFLSTDSGSVIPKTLDFWSHSLFLFEDGFFSCSVWFKILCRGWMQTHQNTKNFAAIYILFVLILIHISIFICICFLPPSSPLSFLVNLPVIQKSAKTELIFCSSKYFSDVVGCHSF